MTEHTPGQWVATWSDVPHSSIGEGWTVDGEEHSICCLDGPRNVNEANARLIAAAPDLLEALEQAYDLLEKVAPYIEPLHAEQAMLLSATPTKMRAAIAKARSHPQ